MNLAIKKFRMPFNSGDAIIFPFTDFWYKTSYDKFYVLNVDDYLSRAEVLEAALKNSYLVASKQSTDMTRKCDRVLYSIEEVDDNGNPWMTPPEIFGTFLGRIIPFTSLIPKRSLEDTLLSELVSTSKDWSSNQFFEPLTDFWMEILPGPHKTFKNQTLKPIWVLVNSPEMRRAWSAVYEEFKTEGLPRIPMMEESPHATFTKSFQYPPLPK